MKIIVFKEPAGWRGRIVDNNETLYESFKYEQRAGCAVRFLMNAWQSMHGAPAATTFELGIDEW